MSPNTHVWQVKKDDFLVEINTSKLNFESRLEDWLVKDISILSKDLLVIGRQISTDFGGIIDLLCVDSLGDIVILELK
ncbi:MAG: endonuclease NucS [Pseudanabaenaceae cyanobacterium bins.39]|nr:endonuclease NucS [Pseudanabaenaceae cyanobacterium bins.39]